MSNERACGNLVEGAEVVVCDGDLSYRAHRELFKFEQDRYVICKDSPLICAETIRTGPAKLHFVCRWKGILTIAMWRNDINLNDVMYILKSVGMSSLDLNPFLGADIEDIFPALYYGKHFDVLRKVCNQAKKIAEDRLKSKGLRVDCHLVAEDSRKIVASSL